MINLLSPIFNLFAKPEPDPEAVEANYYARAIIAELNRKGMCYVRKYKDGGQELETVKFGSPLRVLPDRVEIQVVDMPYGWDFKDLKKDEILENLSTKLKRVVEVRHARGSGFVLVVRRHQASHAANFKYTDLKPPKGYDPKKTPLYIPIGRDENGQQVWFDMATAPHVLVGGTTGGGKSQEMHGVLGWLFSHVAPEDLGAVIVDLKDGVELNRYNGLPHLLFPVAYNHDAAFERFMWINQEIESRAELFRAYGANNVETYRARSGKPLKRILFVVEEFANIAMFEDPDKREMGYKFIKDGAQRARSFGIHFWFVTQRPSVKVIDGDTRMNFPVRLAFRMASDIDSRVILGNDLAAQGLMVGDFVFQSEKVRDVTLRGIYFEPVNGDEMKQVDDLIKLVKSQYQLDTENKAQQLTFEQEQRQALIEEMLRYSQQRMGGEFAVKPMYQVFKEKVNEFELNTIAKELEAAGILSPPSGRVPRKIVSLNGFEKQVS
jgi:S-DNA-T family DNA segregation ATPase FtsK/SpoIIIE